MKVPSYPGHIVPQTNFYGLEVQLGIFWGLNFGPEIFWVLIFAPIRSCLSLESQGTPAPWGKCPLQSSMPSKFSCRGSNFFYSLAQWAMVQAIHRYFKLNHHLTQACNISGASKMFKLLVLRTIWNSGFLFKP